MIKQKCVILGCGHSGTTVLSGLLYFNGYKMLSVPTYTYEDFYLNRLTEKILEESNVFFKRKNIKYYIDKLEKKTNGLWVIKDPFLNFLINDFDAVIDDNCKLLIIFRKPGKVINHLYQELKYYIKEKTNEEIKMMARNQWILSNKAILDFIKDTKREYFIVEYDELLSLKNTEILERFLGHGIDFSFINKKLNRSKDIYVDEDVEAIYEKLKKKKIEVENIYKDKINVSVNYFNKNNIFYYYYKKFTTKLLRKIFFRILKNRPIYLRKPYPKI